jgi:hypothetical protein
MTYRERCVHSARQWARDMALVVIMADPVGADPTTSRFSDGRSTVELQVELGAEWSRCSCRVWTLQPVGGPRGIRTHYLFPARETLSRLS